MILLSKEMPIVLESSDDYLKKEELTIEAAYEILWAYQCVKHDKTSAVFCKDGIVIASSTYLKKMVM